MSGAAFDTEVLIVGAGPVGLTLAIDLGQKGIKCTLIEQKEAPQFLPKMERCNSRSMEIFRRLGLSDKIRAAGFPRDVSMDVFLVKSLMEEPLLRLEYPSVAEAQADIAAHNDGSRPLEAYQLISQYTLEPLLKVVAEERPNVTVKYGHELGSFTQDGSSVTAHIATAAGVSSTVTAAYMVGCDGGASTVRKQLDIKLRGDGNLLELRQALFKAPALFERISSGKGRHYHIVDDRSSMIVVQDDTRHFSLHSIVETDADMSSVFEAAVGDGIDYKMLYVGKWRQNLLLADSYSHDRVFLAGDAVHLVIPTGGLGMNTGVGDAIDLSWKLAATLKGWGGPNLLASYETERRQVGARNVEASRYASQGRRKWRASYQPNIWDDTPSGRAVRSNLVGIANVEQRKTNEMIGAELGYRYVGSPIICDEGQGPDHEFMRYVPTTRPGARLPHLWLDDGSPVQDCLGPGFAILCLGGAKADVRPLAEGFRRVGAPFQIFEDASERLRDVYGYDYLLVRPDMHVAWRGNELPLDSSHLARRVSGH